MIDKEDFIKKYLQLLEKELKENLPNNGTLDELFNRSFRIIKEYENGVKI